jgi:hypothetical protein
MVELRLQLRGDDYVSYRAMLLSSDGSELWQADNLQMKTDAGNRLISFGVPARLLPPGTYKVKVSGVLPDGKVEDLQGYQFTVTL